MTPAYCSICLLGIARSCAASIRTPRKHGRFASWWKNDVNSFNERIRFSQRLHSHLKLYFPQVLNWFCDISSQIAEHFLERGPTLEAVQKARPKTLERFLNDHNSRHADTINMRLEEIRRAVTATHDSAVTIASSSAALALVKILREIRDAISSYDSQIEKLAQAHPDLLILIPSPVQVQRWCLDS